MAKQKTLFGDFIKKSEYIIDFATGKKLKDTPEEAIRQKVEHFLVEQKGYLVTSLRVNL